MSDIDNDAAEQQLDFERGLAAISDAAVLAKNDKDYLSYSTVLDVHLGDPDDYTNEQRVQLLRALRNVLENDDELLQAIGWDLPQLLIIHVESDYDFRLGIRNSPAFVEILEIFRILSVSGNAKEVFLKTVEALYNLRFTDPTQIFEPDIPEITEPDNVGGVTSSGKPVLGVAGETHAVRKQTIREQYFDLKFYLLYELLSSTLKRIDVLYPSRFLATATSVLLSTVASNMADFTVLSLGVVMRRLFIFVRDYDPPANPNISAAEVSLQQRLLQTFITWTIRICLDRFSVQWSQRLFYEIKIGVSNSLDADERNKAFTLALHTFRLTEVMERFSQVSFSFDLDPVTELRKLATKETLNENLGKEDADGLSNSTFSNLSDDGIFLLATQVVYESRGHKDDIDFPTIVNISLKLLERPDGVVPLGVNDGICFWGLWSTRNITSQEIQKVDKDDLFRYLQQLMIMSTTGDDKTGRYLTYSLTARLLSLHKPEVTFEFLVDTLKYCPYETIKDAAVRMLKSFCFKSNAVDDLADKLESSNINSVPIAHTGFIDLTAERTVMIQELIDKSVREVAESGKLNSESLPILLSWINFATVIPTSEKFVEGLVSRSNDITEIDHDIKDETILEELRGRQQIVNIAVASLKSAQLKNISVAKESVTE